MTPEERDDFDERADLATADETIRHLRAKLEQAERERDKLFAALLQFHDARHCLTFPPCDCEVASLLREVKHD